MEGGYDPLEECWARGGHVPSGGGEAWRCCGRGKGEKCKRIRRSSSCGSKEREGEREGEGEVWGIVRV